MNRPIQALLSHDRARTNLSIDYQVAVFAFRVKNWVRPLGLRALSLPCQLMGTGMAFPWELINSVDLATGAIVEDLKLGLDLARIGYPPYFCRSAGISSQFPLSIKGAKSQRKRWEQGHLGMIQEHFPTSSAKVSAREKLRVIALCLDMAVPPLTLLAMMIDGDPTAIGLRTFIWSLIYRVYHKRIQSVGLFPCRSAVLVQIRSRYITGQIHSLGGFLMLLASFRYITISFRGEISTVD